MQQHSCTNSAALQFVQQQSTVSILCSNTPALTLQHYSLCSNRVQSLYCAAILLHSLCSTRPPRAPPPPQPPQLRCRVPPPHCTAGVGPVLPAGLSTTVLLLKVCFFDDADISTTFGFTNTTSTSTKKCS